MTTFTLGTQFEVDANGGLARVATLTATNAIALYSSATSGVEARYLTNASGIITGGTVLTIDANQADSITICPLSSTSAVIGYAYGATHVTRVLTVSGTTLTANAVKNMTDTGVDYLACEFLDTNKIIYIYTDSSNDGQARVLTISGTTITENAAFTFESVLTVSNCAMTALDTVTAAVGYVGDNGGGSVAAYAEILDISGTTITGNTELQVYSSSSSSGQSMIGLSVSVSDTAYFSYTSLSASPVANLKLLKNTAGTISVERTIAGAGNAENCVQIPAVHLMAGSDPGWDTVVFVRNETFGTDHLIIQEYDWWNGNQGFDTTITTTAGVTSEMQAKLFPGTETVVIVWNASTEAIIVDFPVLSHIWLSTDGAATFANIGDSAWTTNVVGGVVVVPGTAYQTIFAAVGTSLYKTVNGGTAWTLETAVGYECDFLDLEKDNTTVFLAKRDAAGTNRASLWDSVGASLTHINTGKSTTGGATSGSDVV